MQLREIMSTRVVTIDSTAAASVAWSRMQQRRIRHLVVVEDAYLVGLISERDLGGRNGAEIRRGHTVEDLMTRRIVTAGPDASLREAANLMRGNLIGCLPVLDGDRLVGIVTATDVLDQLGRGTRPAGRPEQRTLRMSASRRQAAERPIVRRRKRSETGRRRPRKPESSKRAPFPGQLSKAIKRQSGRAGASLTPAHIRVRGVELSQDDQVHIRRKIGRRLGKFANSIERISVRVEDVNGPRGGVDKICRIKVVLNGLPSVVFEGQDAILEAAIDRAFAGAERAVRRSVQRRRMRPIKSRRGGDLVQAA